MQKPFKFGIVVGRFQPLHLGHCEIIDKALELCEIVSVYIGSSQESRTTKNPLTYIERENLLREVYGYKIHVKQLPDAGLGNTAEWGKYLMKLIQYDFCLLNKTPDILISGEEERRFEWKLPLYQLYVPKTIDVSATKIRASLLEDDRETFEKYTHNKLHKEFDYLKAFMQQITDTNTKSI